MLLIAYKKLKRNNLINNIHNHLLNFFYIFEVNSIKKHFRKSFKYQFELLIYFRIILEILFQKLNLIILRDNNK